MSRRKEKIQIHEFSIRKQFYIDLLTVKVKGLFNIDCPDWWDKDALLKALIFNGVVSIFGNGLTYALPCSLGGQNVFYKPNKCIIANPYLPKVFAKNYTIGKNCEILTLLGTDNLFTIRNIIDVYATKLANCDAAIDTNLYNCKVVALFECETKADAERLKLVYDNISMGEPAVFYRSNRSIDGSGTNITYNNVKNTYIVDLVQIEKRKIVEEFLTIFGINNANTEKRERLNSDEVNSNNYELAVNIAYMKKNIEDCIKRINKMFPNLNFNLTLEDFNVSRETLESEEVNE